MSGVSRKWNHVIRTLQSLNMGLWEVGSHFGPTPTQDTHMEKSSGRHGGAGKEPDSFSSFSLYLLSTYKVLDTVVDLHRHHPALVRTTA